MDIITDVTKDSVAEPEDRQISNQELLENLKLAAVAKHLHSAELRMKYGIGVKGRISRSKGLQVYSKIFDPKIAIVDIISATRNRNLHNVITSKSFNYVGSCEIDKNVYNEKDNLEALNAAGRLSSNELLAWETKERSLLTSNSKFVMQDSEEYSDSDHEGSVTNNSDSCHSWSNLKTYSQIPHPKSVETSVCSQQLSLSNSEIYLPPLKKRKQMLLDSDFNSYCNSEEPGTQVSVETESDMKNFNVDCCVNNNSSSCSDGNHSAEKGYLFGQIRPSLSKNMISMSDDTESNRDSICIHLNSEISNSSKKVSDIHLINSSNEVQDVSQLLAFKDLSFTSQSKSAEENIDLLHRVELDSFVIDTGEHKVMKQKDLNSETELLQERTCKRFVESLTLLTSAMKTGRIAQEISAEMTNVIVMSNSNIIESSTEDKNKFFEAALNDGASQRASNNFDSGTTGVEFTVTSNDMTMSENASSTSVYDTVPAIEAKDDCTALLQLNVAATVGMSCDFIPAQQTSKSEKIKKLKQPNFKPKFVRNSKHVFNKSCSTAEPSSNIAEDTNVSSDNKAVIVPTSVNNLSTGIAPNNDSSLTNSSSASAILFNNAPITSDTVASHKDSDPRAKCTSDESVSCTGSKTETNSCIDTDFTQYSSLHINNNEFQNKESENNVGNNSNNIANFSSKQTFENLKPRGRTKKAAIKPKSVSAEERKQHTEATESRLNMELKNYNWLEKKLQDAKDLTSSNIPDGDAVCAGRVKASSNRQSRSLRSNRKDIITENTTNSRIQKHVSAESGLCETILNDNLICGQNVLKSETTKSVTHVKSMLGEYATKTSDSYKNDNAMQCAANKLPSFMTPYCSGLLDNISKEELNSNNITDKSEAHLKDSSSQGCADSHSELAEILRDKTESTGVVVDEKFVLVDCDLVRVNKALCALDTNFKRSSKIKKNAKVELKCQEKEFDSYLTNIAQTVDSSGSSFTDTTAQSECNASIASFTIKDIESDNFDLLHSGSVPLIRCSSSAVLDKKESNSNDYCSTVPQFESVCSTPTITTLNAVIDRNNVAVAASDSKLYNNIGNESVELRESIELNTNPTATTESLAYRFSLNEVVMNKCCETNLSNAAMLDCDKPILTSAQISFELENFPVNDSKSYSKTLPCDESVMPFKNMQDLLKNHVIQEASINNGNLSFAPLCVIPNPDQIDALSQLSVEVCSQNDASLPTKSETINVSCSPIVTISLANLYNSKDDSVQHQNVACERLYQVAALEDSNHNTSNKCFNDFNVITRYATDVENNKGFVNLDDINRSVAYLPDRINIEASTGNERESSILSKDERECAVDKARSFTAENMIKENDSTDYCAQNLKSNNLIDVDKKMSNINTDLASQRNFNENNDLITNKNSSVAPSLTVNAADVQKNELNCLRQLAEVIKTTAGHVQSTRTPFSLLLNLVERGIQYYSDNGSHLQSAEFTSEDMNYMTDVINRIQSTYGENSSTGNMSFMSNSTGNCGIVNNSIDTDRTDNNTTSNNSTSNNSIGINSNNSTDNKITNSNNKDDKNTDNSCSGDNKTDNSITGINSTGENNNSTVNSTNYNSINNNSTCDSNYITDSMSLVSNCAQKSDVSCFNDADTHKVSASAEENQKCTMAETVQINNSMVSSLSNKKDAISKVFQVTDKSNGQLVDLAEPVKTYTDGNGLRAENCDDKTSDCSDELKSSKERSVYDILMSVVDSHLPSTVRAHSQMLSSVETKQDALDISDLLPDKNDVVLKQCLKDMADIRKRAEEISKQNNEMLQEIFRMEQSFERIYSCLINNSSLDFDHGVNRDNVTNNVNGDMQLLLDKDENVCALNVSNVVDSRSSCYLPAKMQTGLNSNISLFNFVGSNQELSRIDFNLQKDVKDAQESIKEGGLGNIACNNFDSYSVDNQDIIDLSKRDVNQQVLTCEDASTYDSSKDIKANEALDLSSPASHAIRSGSAAPQAKQIGYILPQQQVMPISTDKMVSVLNDGNSLKNSKTLAADDSVSNSNVSLVNRVQNNSVESESSLQSTTAKTLQTNFTSLYVKDGCVATSSVNIIAPMIACGKQGQVQSPVFAQTLTEQPTACERPQENKGVDKNVSVMSSSSSIADLPANYSSSKSLSSKSNVTLLAPTYCNHAQILKGVPSASGDSVISTDLNMSSKEQAAKHLLNVDHISSESVLLERSAVLNVPNAVGSFASSMHQMSESVFDTASRSRGSLVCVSSSMIQPVVLKYQALSGTNVPVQVKICASFY